MIDLEERFIEKKSFFSRLVIVYLFFGFLFIFFLYTTYSLQVYEYDDYEVAALKNKTKEVLVQPVRGIIYDRSRNIIVNNVPSYDLIIKPSKIKNLNNFIFEISKIIDIDKDNLDYVLKNFSLKANYNRELILKRNLSQEEIAKFEVRGYKFPSAFIDVRYSRYNNYPKLFSHATGYVGGVSNDELVDILDSQSLSQIETIFKYSNGYQIGKTGIEKSYDKKLRGKFGKKIGNDFFEGKITLPIIILNQKCNSDEKIKLNKLFTKEYRDENEFNFVLDLITKYNVISECYQKADYFISLASNSLNIIKDSEEKNILKKLTSFSIERSF